MKKPIVSGGVDAGDGESYGSSCLCQPRAVDTDSTRTSVSEISEISFFDHCAKSHRFDS